MPHKWFQLSDFKNLATNANILQNLLSSNTYSENRPTTVFSHVPKNAGTTLESILAKNFLMADLLHINAPDLNQQPLLLSIKKNPPKLICGHHPLHGLLYQLVSTKNLYHFTMLRDPIERVVSYYNYVKAKTDHPMHAYARDNSITDFLHTCPSPELSNGQARRFSGHLHNNHDTESHKMFSIAKTNLENCFSRVFTTCLFDESLLILKNDLDLNDIYYQRKNISARFISRSDLTEKEEDAICDANAVDMKLYHWAKDRLNTQINAEIKPAEITAFRNNNKSWNQLVHTL